MVPDNFSFFLFLFSFPQTFPLSFFISTEAGESKVAKENTHLGDLILSGLTVSKTGLQIEVSATVEEDGLIKVAVVEAKSKKAAQISIPAASK